VSKTEFWEEWVHLAFWDYVPPFVCLFGTGLNVLTITVLLVRKFGKASTRILLVTLALADTAVLIAVLLPQWLDMSLGLKFQVLTPASCAIQRFTTFFFFHFSSWSIVLISVERWVSVRYPLKAKMICTAKTTTVALVTLFLALFALNVHILFFEKLHKSFNECTHTYINFWNFTWRWIDFVAYTGIPVMVIAFCNVSIASAVADSYGVRKQITYPGNVNRQSVRLTSVTYMLTTVCVTFVVLTLPVSVYYIVRSYTMDQLVTDHDYAVDWLINDIVNLLSYLNNSLNFLLYCMSGSKFRREVHSMFHPNKSR
jgi:hypothetical protein